MGATEPAPQSSSHDRKTSFSTPALGLLLFAMGIGKLVSGAPYVEALAQFQLIPTSFLPMTATAWTLAELVTGALLIATGIRLNLSRRYALIGAALAVSISLAYAILTFSAYSRGIPISNCTCFGVHLKQRLSGRVLAQDVYMLLWSTWELVRFARMRSPRLATH